MRSEEAQRLLWPRVARLGFVGDERATSAVRAHPPEPAPSVLIVVDNRIYSAVDGALRPVRAATASGTRAGDRGAALVSLRPTATLLTGPILGPNRRGPNDAAGFAQVTDAWSSNGLRRPGFPSPAASLLPGLLAATRPGLPPAGDRAGPGLSPNDQLNTSRPSSLGAQAHISRADYSARLRR